MNELFARAWRLFVTSFVNLAAVSLSTLLVGGANAQPLTGSGESKKPEIELHFEKAEDAVKAGNFTKALESVTAALSLAEANQQPQLAGMAYGWRSQIRFQLGDVPEAISDLQHAAKAMEMAGGYVQAIGALDEKSALEEGIGNMTAAEASLVAARKLASTHALNEEGTAIACSLVRLYVRMGKKGAAELALADAESGPPTNDKGKGRLLLSRARYNSAFGDKGEALAAYKEAVPILLMTGDFSEAANAQYNQAVQLGEMKRFDEAETLLDEAVVNFSRVGSLGGAGMASSLKAWHLIEQDRLDAAETVLKQADKILRSANFVASLAENEMRYAYYWRKRNDPAKSREFGESAAILFEKMGAVDQARSLREAFSGN
jgi:tetratricopeptide (TPR) repeat protein